MDIQFDSPFDIEEHKTCDWDYLELTNGVNDRAERIIKGCGAGIPSTHQTSGNRLGREEREDVEHILLVSSIEYLYLNEETLINCRISICEYATFFLIVKKFRNLLK